FQLFVRVFDVVATHHGLDRLGQHFPAGIEVGSNLLRVELEFADAFEAGFVGDHAVGEADTEVAQHGGVGQIALPAGNRQFARQVLEQCVGDTQVAFGVFEVDRVDLVRHG